MRGDATGLGWGFGFTDPWTLPASSLPSSGSASSGSAPLNIPDLAIAGPGVSQPAVDLTPFYVVGGLAAGAGVLYLITKRR